MQLGSVHHAFLAHVRRAFDEECAHCDHAVGRSFEEYLMQLAHFEQGTTAS